MSKKSLPGREISFGVEYDLLLLCSRFSMVREEQQVLQGLLRRDIDWSFFFDLALRHKVFPLVYRQLKAAPSESIPGCLLDNLRSLVLDNRIQNMQLCRALVELVALFRQEGLKVIPFKGPLLSLWLYDDLSLRSSVDLDLLVQVQQLRKAIRVLQTVGYCPRVECVESEYAIIATAEGAVPLSNESSGVSIDLHWKLNDRSFRMPYDFPLVEKGTVPIEMADQVMDSLAHEYLLVYLCIHGSHHCWVQLDSIGCVAGVLMQAESSDWTRVDWLIRQLGCRRIVHTGLLLAHELYGVELPHRLLRQMKDKKRTLGQVEQLKQKLFVPREDFYHSGPYSRSFVYHFLNHDRWPDRMAFVVKLVFCPSYQDVSRFHFRPSLSLFYYFCRPFRLVGQFFLRKVKMFRHFILSG